MEKAEKDAAIGIVAALVLGAIIAWAGGDGAEQLSGLSLFAVLTIFAFGVNIVAFVPSFVAKTEHYYDLTGSLTYITTTIVALVLSANLDTRSIIIGVLIFIWAGRLGTFLFRRVKRDGGDSRFDKIKQSWLRFLMTWCLQGLWVTVTAGAAFAAISSGEKQPLGIVGIVGLVVWIVGFGIEAVSDSQKTAFKKDLANKGKFIDAGLWSWSRHPNYFGEIMLWTGMAILALPALVGWQHLTLISPVFVALLLTKISGLPMLERRADKKWGGQPDYEAYKASTPVLIPRPPRG